MAKSDDGNSRMTDVAPRTSVLFIRRKLCNEPIRHRRRIVFINLDLFVRDMLSARYVGDHPSSKRPSQLITPTSCSLAYWR